VARAAFLTPVALNKRSQLPLRYSSPLPLVRFHLH